MYTFRPLRSWNHFYQASTFYQLYLKSLGQPTSDDPSFLGVDRLHQMSRKQRRTEQSMYWSCFKSEVEIRIELPLGQSTIADLEYPDMFPSPPSPPPEGASSDDTVFEPWRHLVDSTYGMCVNGIHRHGSGSADSLPEEVRDVRQHSRTLYNEEESWYYYLTEVALRRISNRIINTFYSEDRNSWLNITRLIPIATELDAQISNWAANLPPVMQHFESFPGAEVPFDVFADSRSSASKELSWATQNRILEMRSWLYQPFLYYAIHHPNNRKTGGVAASPLSTEQDHVLRNLISLAVECNLKILETRSLLHRHHGIWFDLRALVTALLLLIAAARSGHVEMPKGLFKIPDAVDPRLGKSPFDNAFRALRFWEDESLDIHESRLLLQDLVDETRHILAGRQAI